MIARPEDFNEDDQVPMVPFVPFRCPHCGRHKPFTYGVVGRVRYHKCQACGKKYRSLEVAPGDVQGWPPPRDSSA